MRPLSSWLNKSDSKKTKHLGSNKDPEVLSRWRPGLLSLQWVSKHRKIYCNNKMWTTCESVFFACWGSHHMGGDLMTTSNPYGARCSPLGRSLSCLLSRGKEGGVEDGRLGSNCIFVSAILCCCRKASASFVCAQVSCYVIRNDIYFDAASTC